MLVLLRDRLPLPSHGWYYQDQHAPALRSYLSESQFHTHTLGPRPLHIYILYNHDLSVDLSMQAYQRVLGFKYKSRLYE